MTYCMKPVPTMHKRNPVKVPFGELSPLVQVSTLVTRHNFDFDLDHEARSEGQKELRQIRDLLINLDQEEKKYIYQLWMSRSPGTISRYTNMVGRIPGVELA
jgi:hypothetical protein